MSKKHGDQIMEAATRILLTDQGRSHAFSYLAGILVAKAEEGRPVSATALVKAVVAAVESASKNHAEERARAEEEVWRAAQEVELPEPRDIPDLDPTHFSHAMTGVGKETAWCGAPGPVAVFAFSVTCPVCKAMLSREEAGDLGARTLAVPPLADDTSASDETTQAEIVIGEARYGDAELDGFACILCHKEFAVGEASVPAGVVDGGPQVFAHGRCLSERQAQEAWTTEQAEKVIEEWTPGPELAAMVEADRAALPELAAAVVNGSTPRWVHSGPCIYCAHGPACVTCDLAKGPHWGAGEEYPGPVCGRCSEECKRREIAADPYYSGDYVTMFGDDE